MEIYNEDCLGDNGLCKIADKSIDMVLCDPPYGVTECKWDTVVDVATMFQQYTRVIKDDGAIVIFSQQPFSSKLVLQGLDIFKYALVWKKSRKGNFAQAPYRVLCQHEDVLVFSKGKTAHNAHIRMKYNPQGVVECHKQMKGKTGSSEHRKGRRTQDDYTQTKANYPTSVLYFPNENGYHPTQKPVKLCEWLIKTYTNEGETVLDNTMGSGTTGVACKNTGRKFIGFELDKKYFEVAKERLGLD